VPHLLIFGLGYTAARLAARLSADGWTVTATSRDGRAGTICFSDESGVSNEINRASHILSSVPPLGDDDPVLTTYGNALRAAPSQWFGYFSSTGVYGNAGGAWVDESAPIGRGRRAARTQADRAWQKLRSDVRVFRLPGIYGPGRSALDRVAGGQAHRIKVPQQVFSRIHVDDIVSATIASFVAPAGVYNIADDEPCSQNCVIEYAADLLGLDWPLLQSIEDANLSPMARAFYAENRRVANGKAKRLLNWTPAYPTYREGLRAIRVAQPPV
jgi:nucleoside-diphosphate-sugar epimerase